MRNLEKEESKQSSVVQSRSNDVNLAMGFNPRSQGIISASRQRRLNSIVADATTKLSASFRGLKPTVTFNLSLRDKRIVVIGAACLGIIFASLCFFPSLQFAQQQPAQQTPPPQRPPQPKPTRKQVLAWGDQRYGVQHDAVTRAMVTMEKMGRESGAYDMYIRTDSQLITKQPVTMAGNTRPTTNKTLNYFDAIFFYGVREIDITDQQKADLMSFIKEDGKGFVGRQRQQGDLVAAV